MNPELKKDEANKDDDAKIKVEDLPLKEAQGDAVKGGPLFPELEGIRFERRTRGGG